MISGERPSMNSTVRLVTHTKKTGRRTSCPTASIQSAGAGYRERLCPGGLLPAELFRLVAEIVRFLEKRLLLGRILLQIGLEPQQQSFVGHRIRVVGLDRQRFVDRLDTLEDVV